MKYLFGSALFIMIIILYNILNSKTNFSYFDDKNIVITGASSGIGKSIATLLEQHTHANLFLLARSFENNENKYKCDCSNYDMVEKVISQIDTIDIVIHSAGTGDWKYLQEMSNKEIETCLGAPLISSINITRLSLPKMLDKNMGQLVFIQSPVIIQPWGSCTAYSISRWGMKGLAESLRADLYNTNISVSEVVLGRTESNYFKTNENADKRFPKIGNLIKRITPDESGMAVIKTIIKGKEYEYYPFTMKLIVNLYNWFPSVVRYLTFKTSFTS